MYCSPLGVSVHGIIQARILNWLHALLPGIFLTPGPNPYLLCLLHWQAGSLPLAHTVIQIFPILANFCLPVLSAVKRRALKFMMIIRYLSIFPFSFFSFLFMYFELLYVVCTHLWYYVFLRRWLEKEMATHASILAWRIPQTEEPGGSSLRGHKESDTAEWVSTHSTRRWSFSCF